MVGGTCGETGCTCSARTDNLSAAGFGRSQSVLLLYEVRRTPPHALGPRSHVM
jgi:hypothetical protein